MKQKIKTVIFDWDKTLGAVLGEASDSERLVEMYHRLGYDYNLAQVEEAAAEYVRLVEKKEIAGVIHPQKASDIKDFYQEISRLLGDSLSEAEASELYGLYPQLPFYLFEETIPLLEWLEDEGYQLGIITNHLSSIRPTIEQLVGRWFSAKQVIISEEFGCLKPDPQIFAHAIDLLGAEQATTIFIGDNFLVDAVGSIKAGGYAHSIWLDQYQQESQPVPEQIYRIEKIGEVRSCLVQLNK